MRATLLRFYGRVRERGVFGRGVRWWRVERERVGIVKEWRSCFHLEQVWITRHCNKLSICCLVHRRGNVTNQGFAFSAMLSLFPTI